MGLSDLVPVVTMPVTIHSAGEYQDIREELRKRIDLLERMMGTAEAEFAAKQEKAIAAHKATVDGFKATITNYRNMLELEESFAKSVLQAQNTIGQQPGDASVKLTIPTARPSLAQFFISELVLRGPLSKEELRQAGERAGYFEVGGGGRSTHATLENIKRNNRVILGADGKFSANNPEKALL
jgi:hypothetical protein